MFNAAKTIITFKDLIQSGIKNNYFSISPIKSARGQSETLDFPQAISVVGLIADTFLFYEKHK